MPLMPPPLIEKEKMFDLSSIEGQKEYAHYHLSSLAEITLKLASDDTFSREIHEKIRQTEGEDYRVLIEDLDLLTRLDESARSEYVISIEAFKSVTDEPLFPQLYIPFYENHHGNTNSRKASDSDPTIIIGTGDEGRENATYTGYKLNASGLLEPLDFQISEEYASQNEVWVFSISESTPSVIDYNEDFPNGRVQTLDADARINWMKVKDHKEEWAYGASEVHILTVFSDYNYANIEPKYYGGDIYQGGKIRDFSRKEVKNESGKSLNFYILADWDYNVAVQGTDYANFVIFEYDPWPAG